MEIPSRNFYRYLLLCGNQNHTIHAHYDNASLVLPPRPDIYFTEQVDWARQLLGSPSASVPTAVRRAGLWDMWAAHKKKRVGTACTAAYHLTAIQNVREPMEALLLAGWPDYDIARALSSSICHNISLDTEEVAAFRRYFFDPSILGAQDRLYLALRAKHLRVAMLALRTDTLLFALGLKYNTAKDRMDRAYTDAWYTWITHLEMMPLRTDREGLKSLSTFLSTLKSLDRSEGGSEDEEIPLVDIVRGSHKELEEGFNE